MSKTNTQLVEESPQYKKLLGMFLRQRRKIRSMQKSFAEIECAVIHKCDRSREFIIGECEFYRGEFEPRCVCQKNQ
jgi:hypothetical protein